MVRTYIDVSIRHTIANILFITNLFNKLIQCSITYIRNYFYITNSKTLIIIIISFQDMNPIVPVSGGNMPKPKL